MVTMASHLNNYNTSADGCSNIVHSLMCHRQGREPEGFAKRAIESLVKKLMERKDELDSLIQAITTNGTHQSKCATIQRTLDGRLQIAGRKGFPHVIYARIWRWPDLHKSELRHIMLCKFAFDLKQESVCINPYHYERIVSPGFDLSGLSLRYTDATGLPQVNNGCNSNALMPTSNHAHLTNKALTIQHLPSDSFLHIPDPRLSVSTNYPPSQHFLSPVNTDTIETSLHKWSVHSVAGDKSMDALQKQSDSLEYLSSSQSSPSFHSVSPELEVIHRSPSSSSEISTCSSTMSIPLTTNHASLASEIYSRSVQSQTFLRQFPEASGTTWANRIPNDYPSGNTYWSNEWHLPSDLIVQTPFSNQPSPEYWCEQIYFELNQQVGETFKVPFNVKTITIDGYTDPSSKNRFCLGQLSNVNRTEIIEKARLHIGKGVQLDYTEDGDVWIRCLGNHSVFIQSFYLDSESGRQPGEAVHKIYPNAHVKIFDIRKCYCQIHEQVATAQAASGAAQAAAIAENITDSLSVGTIPSVATGIAVDDLRRFCLLRLSFVKGWGPDYPRKNIEETPCWVEIQLYRPLQFLDEILQSLPGNDIQPRLLRLLS